MRKGFLIYEEGLGFLIYEEVFKYFPYLRRSLIIYDFATAPF
jgi:hypothetical protein